MMDQDPQSVLDVLHISSFMAEATVYGDEIDQASQVNPKGSKVWYNKSYDLFWNLCYIMHVQYKASSVECH